MDGWLSHFALFASEKFAATARSINKFRPDPLSNPELQ